MRMAIAGAVNRMKTDQSVRTQRKPPERLSGRSTPAPVECALGCLCDDGGVQPRHLSWRATMLLVAAGLAFCLVVLNVLGD